MVNKEPTDKDCEKQGKILRDAHTKKAYTRKSFKRCPPNKKNCDSKDKIEVQESVVMETYVPASCVKDMGEKGETPPEKRWLPPLEKGGLSQFFDNEKMAYDQVSCVKAGLRANKYNHPYSELSQKFVAMSNLRVNTNPDQAVKFEECRQNTLIGYDPESDPIGQKGVSKLLQDVKVDVEKAKELRKQWKPIIDKEN